jgi:antitoxin MazE
MRTKIVRIGNSQGVRIPKPLLREAGLAGEVNLRVEDGTIVIEADRNPREGWEEAAEAAAADQDDRLLDPPLSTAFDDMEWTWE